MLSLSCFLMSVSLIWSKSDSDPKQHPLVVLVVDGLKHGFSQYFSPLYDSKLHTLMENGIYARLKSVFPAETLPNLQSIATGKLAGEHGIVSDTMFDIGRYKFFNSSMENSWDAGWYLVNRNVKSIWHANEIREGYRSACIGYPGCCAKRKGFPIVSYCLPARTAKRVPRVLDEIHVLLSEGYQFIIAYVQDLGKILRRGGITNKRLLEELGELDYRLGEAIDDMKVFGQWNRVNLLILGATGIMNYDFKATPIIISDYVQFRGFITFGRGPSVQIYQNALRPKWKQLKKLDTIPNVLVIMRNDLWKYLGNVSDISRFLVAWLIAKPGHLIFPNHRELQNSYFLANNGYMPKLKQMMPLIIAHGPDIKQNKGTNETYPITDVYFLMRKLLGLPCGKRKRPIYRILKNSD